LQVLDFLHSEQIIHRDIKSCNILLGMHYSVKLADICLCTQIIHKQNRRTTCAGTLNWMAPEMVKQEPYDCKVELWSLDITTVDMNKGEPSLT
ncbi:PAK3 kinase, partial [Psilopogon haemacephalus]|nr:PAK3 kinase [Psilopogon haemacephalus]